MIRQVVYYNDQTKENTGPPLHLTVEVSTAIIRTNVCIKVWKYLKGIVSRFLPQPNPGQYKCVPWANYCRNMMAHVSTFISELWNSVTVPIFYGCSQDTHKTVSLLVRTRVILGDRFWCHPSHAAISLCTPSTIFVMVS